MLLGANVLAFLLAPVVLWLIRDGLRGNDHAVPGPPGGNSLSSARELPAPSPTTPASDDVRLLQGVLSTWELSQKYYRVPGAAGAGVPPPLPAPAPRAFDLPAPPPGCRMEPAQQWQAAVLMRDVAGEDNPRPANGFVCMGALLSRRVVITSAVCFKLYAEPDEFARSFPRGFRVRVYVPPGVVVDSAPNNHSRMACSSRAVDAAVGRQHCDVEVREVALSSEAGSALLLLSEVLPEAQDGLEHACPPSRQDSVLDYAECLLSGYSYDGRWHANLTRRYCGPSECPFLAPLACAVGKDSFGAVSPGSPLLCRGPGGWRLAGVSLGRRWHDTADPVEFYVFTGTITPWIATVLDSWSQVTTFNQGSITV